MSKAAKELLLELIKQRNDEFITQRGEHLYSEQESQRMARKEEALKRRKAELVRSNVRGQLIGQRAFEHQLQIDYALHYEHLLRQGSKIYMEEQQQQRRATFVHNELHEDEEITMPVLGERRLTEEKRGEDETKRSVSKGYNRLEAVRYAERWWDDYNPQYQQFTDNCTNFISQCVRAGGAQMNGHPERGKGWWFSGDNWSYSWSVAHSFRWNLSGAKSGLRGEEQEKASDLLPGDVICYDFNGDDRWQHTTIVVAKDAYGEPLVNAQTTNSRMRHWAYEDSTAWTPEIKYKFFRILV